MGKKFKISFNYGFYRLLRIWIRQFWGRRLPMGTEGTSRYQVRTISNSLSLHLCCISDNLSNNYRRTIEQLSDNYWTKIEVGPYLVAATGTSALVLRLTPMPHREGTPAMRLKGNQQFNNQQINN